VHVQALQQGGQLHLVVRDTGQGLQQAQRASADGSHFGLAQVRERLATLYGTSAALTLQDAASGVSGVVATLVMPMPVSVPVPVSAPHISPQAKGPQS
jgi:LytS/YehU family sensor histidine kinase